ncbi:YfhO family protein [Candidatus Gottesmanbacteria bacterium]|nr:YfhO family protein [Candidatus Gottesmanbacteria bacterium]
MKRLFWPIVGYSVIVALVFGRALTPGAGEMIWGDDIHRQYYFYRQFFNSFLREGIWPWWNPYLFSGTPFIANAVTNIWYPPTWLFVFLPLNLAYSWHIALHILWAMLGMYTLLRRVISNFQPARPAGGFPISNEKQRLITRLDLGPWVGGLVFGLSGFFAARIWAGHVDVIAAASWMPWVVYTNVKCQTRLPAGQVSNVKWKKECVIAAIVFALQILAGYQTVALFTLEAVFIVTLFHSYFEKSWRPMLRTAIAVVLGLGLAGIQIIPAQEFFRNSIRTYALPYSWAVFGSYTIQNLKQLINPFILGFPSKYTGPSPNFGEMAAYMGKFGLVFAIVPVIVLVLYIFRKVFKRIMNYELGIMDKQTMIFTVSMLMVAAFGLWVSFGWNAPVDLNKMLWDVIPMYKYLRIPSRHLILFVFGMSALAGIGFSFARPPLAKLVIALVVTVDLVWFAKTFVILKPDPATRHNTELVTYLQKNLELGRILPNFNVGMGTRDALDFDAAMGYRMYSASGYDPAILRNYYEFAAAAAGIEKPDVQTSDVQIPYLRPVSRYTDFLNIKYIFVPSWFDSVAGSNTYRLVMEENTKDYFRLYENANVLPRFFLVPTIVALPDRDSITRAIRAGEYDPENAVLVENNDIPADFIADCGTSELPSVAVVLYTMNTIVLNTDAPCNAFLATSEVMYPGWSATVDDVQSALIEGNLAFRTIPVPKGKHTIVMAYQPRVVLIGAGLSIATAAFCVLWTKKKKGMRRYDHDQKNILGKHVLG